MRPLVFALIVAACAVGAPARADEPPPISASLQCDRAVEPGRVRCTVEARVAQGRTLQWADVVIVELPELAQALKGRVGPADSIARDATSERWAFGLVARKLGEGEAKVHVRAVVCAAGAPAPEERRPRCATATAIATAIVRVG
ncbi:MAG: hypothetical protein KIT84_26990 [Labilithrix sp.]|nr:hypothetical protein [Labilithrix sp.]MCW5814702.1 hypothetical protein [Labilithrix sp.]